MTILNHSLIDEFRCTVYRHAVHLGVTTLINVTVVTLIPNQVIRGLCDTLLSRLSKPLCILFGYCCSKLKRVLVA